MCPYPPNTSTLPPPTSLLISSSLPVLLPAFQLLKSTFPSILSQSLHFNLLTLCHLWYLLTPIFLRATMAFLASKVTWE